MTKTIIDITIFIDTDDEERIMFGKKFDNVEEAVIWLKNREATKK